MKKIINGKSLNTATAKLLGSWSYSNRSDFAFCSEDLYRNNRGTYFLHGEGGPMSPYTRSEGQNSWSGDEQLIPMTEDEAKAWAEEKLDTEDYERAFGEAEEAAPEPSRTRVQVSLDNDLFDRFKAYSESEGIPMSRLLDRAIKETYKI